MAHPETVPETNDIETVAPARVVNILGYARVSTHDQNLDAQRDRLIAAGAIRVFTDIVSAQRFDRPALPELLDHARPGDRLCIIRLDRLGRSLRELQLRHRTAGGAERHHTAPGPAGARPRRRPARHRVLHRPYPEPAHPQGLRLGCERLRRLVRGPPHRPFPFIRFSAIIREKAN